MGGRGGLYRRYRGDDGRFHYVRKDQSETQTPDTPTQQQQQQQQPKPISLEEYLGPKGKPMNSVEAAKGANPHFMESVTSGDHKFTHNCQRCVWATELRRRGYDVEARERTSDDSFAKIDPAVPNSFLNVAKGSIQLEKFGSIFMPATAKEVKSAILAHGEGSRGMLTMQGWKGGHVCNWEVRDGKVLIYDGQSNMKHSMTSLKKQFQVFGVGRMDDAELSDPLVREFVKRSGT